jgi:hypothetical protein
VDPRQAKYGPQIALLAFQYWDMAGGSNQNTVGMQDWKTALPQGSSVWTLAQQASMNQTGTDAYNDWVKAGGNINGANSYWGQAVAFFQPQIDTAAKTLASHGTTPATAQQEAQQQYGPQIAMLAFQYWLLDGGINKSTAGYTAWNNAFSPAWTQALQAFMGQTGMPAFNAWGAANEPKSGVNSYWKQAVDLYQPEIDAVAKTLAGGGTPTPAQTAQTAQAEKQYGSQIAMLAFQYWLAGTTKAWPALTRPGKTLCLTSSRRSA